MASFDLAYNTYIKPNEGGYANVMGDKGGETYGGIARNYFSTWSGWKFIDSYKASFGSIARNKMFNELDASVRQFYLDWWNSKYYSLINSQDVANLLFDYNVNSGATAIKAIQKLVGVTQDGAMGPNTIAAINKADTTKLYNDLKENRRLLFEALAKKPGQEQFYDGWMARLSKFQDLVTPTSAGIGIAVVALLVGIFFLTTMDSKKKTVANNMVR